MNLSIKELNELIYSLGITAHKGMFVNKDVNESLLEKLYGELNSKIAEDAIDEEVDEFTDELLGGDLEFSSHFVSNEEANENFLSTLAQDAQRYEDSHMTTSFPMVDPFTSDNEDDFTSAQNDEIDRYETSVIDDYRIHLRKLKTRGYASQAILDYVDLKGAVTHKELERYYKSITGSNSFSHILQNLVIPYKNRKTQRYLAKEGKPYSDAKYVVKVANPSNWVVVESDFIKWIKNNTK
jgi:hypothetical protein